MIDWSRLLLNNNHNEVIMTNVAIKKHYKFLTYSPCLFFQNSAALYLPIAFGNYDDNMDGTLDQE